MLLGREEYLPPGVISSSSSGANYEIRVKSNYSDDRQQQQQHHHHLLGKSWPLMMANGGGRIGSQSTVVMEPTSVLDRNIIRSPSPSSTSTLSSSSSLTPSLSDGAVFCTYGSGSTQAMAPSSPVRSSSDFGHEFAQLLFPLPAAEVADGSLEACVMSSYTRKRDRDRGGLSDGFLNGLDDGDHQIPRSKKNDCNLSGMILDQNGSNSSGMIPAQNGCNLSAMIPDQFALPVELNHQNLSGGGDGDDSACGRLREQLDLYEAVQALYMSSSSSSSSSSGTSDGSSAAGSNPQPVITSFPAFHNHNNHNAAPPQNPQNPAYTLHHHHSYRHHHPLIDTNTNNKMPSCATNPTAVVRSVQQQQQLPAVLDSKPPAPQLSLLQESHGCSNANWWYPRQNGLIQCPAQGHHSYGVNAWQDVAAGRGMRLEEELLMAGHHLWAAAAELAAGPHHGHHLPGARSPHYEDRDRDRDRDRVPLGGGDSSLARQAILARLNQQIVSICSPNSQQQQPRHRAIFRFKEALAATCILNTSPSSCSSSSAITTDPPPPCCPLDTIHKIAAFKRFCELSPIPQFAHFIPNQAILDATQGETSIRIIDFELGFGGQWASFIQEFGRRGGRELKLTGVTIPAPWRNKGTSDPSGRLELGLARENLLEFAREAGLHLSVEAMPLEKAMEVMRRKAGNREVVAVNFGFFGMSRAMAYLQSSSFFATTVSNDHGNCIRQEAVESSFLSWIRQLEPRVVAVVEMEEESSPPLAWSRRHTFERKLESFACVFESLQEAFVASSVAPPSSFDLESMYEIERLILGPRIEDTVYEAFFNHHRHHHYQQSSSSSSSSSSSNNSSSGGSSDSISSLPWRAVLLKAGFVPLPFSNAAESQASCLVKMNKHSGFNFRKQQENVLLLGWFNRPLISASAWI